MKPDLGAIGTDRFLAEFWQRKPCLLRQAYPEWQPELDINDVAGLACEEGVEARLVSGAFERQDWSLSYSPFEEKTLESLPESHWTLLVQDAEKHYPPLKHLLDGFGFIPSWRMDDLMISVAAPGGSVGPHVDQYDVFLVQAAGKRRWQIAREFDPELLSGTELNVLKSFVPEEEWVLEPGDVLYLPPGVAHHGVALDTGMTWSVGLRAPSAADLLQALGEWLAESQDEGQRYSDRGLQKREDRHLLADSDVERVAALLQSIPGEPAFRDFLGSFLSQYRMAHQPAPPPRQTSSPELVEALNAGRRLRHNPWTRLLWMEGEPGAPTEARVYAQGDRFYCTRQQARQICDSSLLEDFQPGEDEAFLALLCRLLDKGHLYLEAV